MLLRQQPTEARASRTLDSSFAVNALVHYSDESHRPAYPTQIGSAEVASRGKLLRGGCRPLSTPIHWGGALSFTMWVESTVEPIIENIACYFVCVKHHVGMDPTAPRAESVKTSFHAGPAGPVSL